MAFLRECGLLLAVWTLLATAQATGRWIGREPAVLLSFAGATGLVLRARPRRGAVRARRALRLLPAGVASGYALLPACAVGIAALGRAIGLDRHPPAAGAPGAAHCVSTLALAPVFEELLYRERLLPAMRAYLGGPPAVVATSLLFALPHLEAWAVLGTFAIGLLLGACMLAGGSVLLCIALHAGFNLALLAAQAGAAGWLLSPAAGAVAGGALLVASLAHLGAGRGHVG